MEGKLHFQTAKSSQDLQFGFFHKFFLVVLLMLSYGVVGQCLTNADNWVGSGLAATTGQGCAGTSYIFDANGDFATSPIVTNPQILTFQKKRSTSAASTTAAATWSMIVQISNNATFTTFTDVATITGITGSCVSESINLSAFAGDRKIRLLDTRGSGVHERTISDISLTCGSSCTTPTISFPSSTISKNVGDANYTHVATSASPGAITYSSNNTSVATVNASTGEVTLGAAGTAIVTASQVASGTYCAATTSYTLTVVSTAPAMSTSGTVTALSTIYGTPSTSQNFTFTATNLTGSNITATAPAGFEISSSSGGPFGATTAFPVTGGSASGTVYVRLAATTAAGTYSGTVMLIDNTNSATATKMIPNSTVNPKVLTITGITAANKLYDGNTAVVVTANPQYVGLANAETFPVSGTVTWAFSTKNVGATLVRTGSYNAPNANYTVTQPTVSANITAKPLTLSGAAAQNKPYDGNTTATITGTLTGVISPDAVTLNGMGTFASPNAGTGIAVTSTATLSGTDAGNYTITQPSGLTANITAVAPTFTASAIGLSVGGTYSLPGTISSNSGGTLTYLLGAATPAGSVTITGNTLNGVAVGTATLTVNQAASGNYTAGSTTVTVNVTTVAYVSGDYRSISDGTWHSTVASGTATWEKYNGSIWSSSGNPKPGTNAASLGDNKVYIRHQISLVGSNTAPYVIVEKDGVLTTTISSTFGNLLIKEGGKFNRNSSGSGIAEGGVFEIENGGEAYLELTNSTASSLSTSIWRGEEVFHPNSTVYITKTQNSGNYTIIPTTLDIKPFNGAYFGNLVIDITAGNTIVILPTGFNGIITAGNMIFRSNINDLRFLNSTYTATINGNLVIESSYSNRKVNLYAGASGVANLTIKGDIIHDSNENLNLNTQSGGTINLNLEGDLHVGSNSKLISTSTTNSTFNFSGIGDGLTPATTQTIDVANNATASNIVFNVNNGAYVKLINQNFALGSNSKFNVLTNGTLDFGFNGTNALNITGNANTGTEFNAQQDSYLKITSPQGISGTAGSSGNIQTNVNPVLNDVATYHYIGKANQITGSGLPTVASGKKVIVEMDSDLLELSTSSTTKFNATGTLEIRRGTVVDNGTTFFTDGASAAEAGNLKMTGGLYKFNDFVSTANSVTYYPRLSGTYNLTGGTVELAATTDTNGKFQRLRGGKQYHNLKISGASSNGGFKGIGNAIVINNTLSITGTAIFDTDSKSVTGNANIIMDGGRWRISKLTNAQPELAGTLHNLSGGTMEYYGTTATTNQSIRGGIDYYNIDINADAVNSQYLSIDDFYNVNTSSSITVAGNLNVNAPAAFKIGSTYNISGSGNIFVNPGATLLYGSENGIKTSGTGTSDGAVRVGGTRSFSPQASYGFIGGQSTMVSGDGLPATIENLYVARTSTSLNTILTNPSLSIKNKLVMVAGNIVTGGNTFQLGTDAVNKGTLEYSSGFVKGTMTRWFNGANSGDASSLFPLGTLDNKTRASRIEFTSTTTPGTLTASVQNTAMGVEGVAALAPIPMTGICSAFSVFNTGDFYWILTPSSLAGNYGARFTKDHEGELVCETTLLNRTATDWTAPGTHDMATAMMGIITARRSGLSTFSDFGFGNRKCGETKTWTGTWSGGTPPTIINKVVFATNYDSATQGGSVSACECEIQSGVTVTMAGGAIPHNMEIHTKLEGSGTLKLENNSSLIQYDDASVNTGNLHMTRNTQPVFRFDYTYWSSPVAAQNLHAVSPTTFFDKYHSWNATLQEWMTHTRITPWNPAATPLPDNVMRPGKGYIIRAPQTYPVEAVGVTPLVYAAPFTGVPNNGIVSVPIVGGTDKYNLVGNPYPSAVNADEFLNDPANTGVVQGTLYFWTHNTPIAQSGGTGMYNYSAADYAVYNGVGSTATIAGANAGGVNNNPNVPNGFIASGQSFFIKGSAAGGTAVFHNSMREKGNNDRFFRYAAAEDSPAPTIEKHRIWLNLSNDTNGFSQSLIGYLENATNGYDRNFDGDLLGGGNVSLYSVLEGSKMTIQGRTLPFDQNDQVPMGFKATTAGNLKVSLDHFDGLFSGQNIYLEDKALNIIHDLKAAPYTFATTAGTFNERFVLRYTNETLSTGENAVDANGVIVAVKDKAIKVVSRKENIMSISVFDLLGRTIYSADNVNALSFSTEEIAAQEQVLVVKIVLENNAKADRKIIFR